MQEDLELECYIRVFLRKNVRSPVWTCRDPFFSDSRDPIFPDSRDPIFNSRDPNRVPKTA